MRRARNDLYPLLKMSVPQGKIAIQLFCHHHWCGIDPLLGGTQTWKLSHWRFIKRDEKERKDMLYLYRLSIPYNHLFVKKNHLFCFLHVFQSQLDCNILKKNVFVSDYKTLRCSQRWLFLPLFCLERKLSQHLLL